MKWFSTFMKWIFSFMKWIFSFMKGISSFMKWIFSSYCDFFLNFSLYLPLLESSYSMENFSTVLIWVNTLPKSASKFSKSQTFHTSLVLNFLCLLQRILLFVPHRIGRTTHGGGESVGKTAFPLRQCLYGHANAVCRANFRGMGGVSCAFLCILVTTQTPCTFEQGRRPQRS